MALQLRGLPSRRTYLLSPILAFVLIYFLFFFDATKVISPASHAANCPPLKGIEDVLVILKTGVTEALEKVPVQIQTSTRCIPNYVLFSDFEEEIAGVRVRDVLRSVNNTIKRTSPDFNLYNRLRESGRNGLSPKDVSRVPNSAYGMPDNPGWKLDKWKFLPMIDEALRVRDDAKWYVFMEADTYFLWQNLLQWLARFDPRKPYYLGNQMQLGDIVFGHGGSGFILSREAMYRASQLRARDVDAWDRLTDEQWAGDCVLGKLLHDAGAPLVWSWPMLQTDPPGEFDAFAEAYSKKAWCFPPIAYHHVTVADIHDLDRLNREFHKEGNAVMLHGDVFRRLIRPRLPSFQDDWDNLSEDEQAAGSLTECKALCFSRRTCLQYSFGSGKCRTSKGVKLGTGKAGVTSGWITERIDAVVQELGSCDSAKWIAP